MLKLRSRLSMFRMAYDVIALFLELPGFRGNFEGAFGEQTDDRVCAATIAAKRLLF